MLTLNIEYSEPELFLNEDAAEAEILAKLTDYKIYESTLMRVAESGNLVEFKNALQYPGFNDFYTKRIINSTIKAGSKNNFTESDVLELVKHLVNNKASLNDDSISYAASKGYYEIAQYLLDHNAVIKPLNEYNLFNSDGDKNEFESFKWLLDHGAKVEKGTVGKVICNNNFHYNMYKLKAFENQKNIDEAIDFLIKIGITNDSKVKEITNKCDTIVKIHEIDITYFTDNSDLIISAIKSGSQNNVQFLLDNGAKVEGKHAGTLPYHLVNYPNAEIVSSIINEFRSQGKKLNDFDKSKIVHKMEHEMEYKYCESNKIIAEFAGIMGDSKIDWSNCVQEL